MADGPVSQAPRFQEGMLEPRSGEMPATDIWPDREGGDQSVGVTLPQVTQMSTGLGMDPVLQFPARQGHDPLLEHHLDSTGVGTSFADEDFLQQWGNMGRKG